MRCRRFALAVLAAAALAACRKHAEPQGRAEIVADPVPEGPQMRREGPAPAPNVGLYVIYPYVNAVVGETDVEEDPKLSIAPGASPGALVIRAIPRRGHGDGGPASAGVPGTVGPEPGGLTFTDAEEHERYRCAPILPGAEDTLLCDNGEPQGIGPQMNPRHRSFLAHRLCGSPAKLRGCAPGDRDRAPPL
jgi:hypothetical protein